MLIRRLARPLLASVFIYGGVQAFRDVQGHAKAASPLIDKSTDQLRGVLPEQLPTDPETLVRADAAVKVGAGALLALGRFPRLSATLLSGSIAATTLSAHRFWEIDDPQLRTGEQVQFLKNLGLLGGLLTTAVDTKGKPSVGYRARRRANRVAEQTQGTVGQVKRRARKVKR